MSCGVHFCISLSKIQCLCEGELGFTTTFISIVPANHRIYDLQTLMDLYTTIHLLETFLLKDEVCNCN